MVKKPENQTKTAEETKENQPRVKVGKLKLNKETIHDLNSNDMKGVRGGLGQLSGTCGCGKNCTTSDNCGS